jgi:hypothetical protein
MSPKTDLAQAFLHLTDVLSSLDKQIDSRARAKEIRVNLTRHIHLISDELEGKSEPCPDHPHSKAFNCPECRSERIARVEYPPNPISDVDARRLGERLEEGL